MYLILLPVDAGIACRGGVGEGVTPQVCRQSLPCFLRVPQPNEESGLEPADGVRRREQVVPQLRSLDYRAFCTRERHEPLTLERRPSSRVS